MADARQELTEADARRRALRLAEQDFPRARGLADAWSRVESNERTLRDLTAKATRAARSAEEARALAVAARAEADATATAHDLPGNPVELERVRTALAALLAGIGRLRRAIGSTGERLGAHHADAERYERARKDRLAAEENYRLRLTGLRTAQQDLRTREEAIGSTEEEILTREQEARQRIAHAAQAVPAAQRTRNDLHDLRVRAEEEEKRLREDLAGQETAVIATGSSLRGALGRPEVVRGAGLDRSSLPEEVADDPGSDVRSRLRALRALADAVERALGRPKGEVSDSTLLNRHTDLRDQLAGGYDAQLEERNGIKVCRLIDDHGSHDVAAVGERIAVQAAEARGRLTEREREVFQRFLTGELGDHLSAQVITAANLVAALNDTLRTVRTSHGLGVELLWKLDEDADADVRAAVELLRSPSSLRTREQTEQLREVLQRRIEDARRADASAGYAAHLRTALDYRDWFRFHTFVVEDAAPGRRRKLTGRTGLSQGEQRVLSYLVLFAAAAAHFTSLAESAPHAPRLILLDDAFAKVDEPTHGRLGRILVDLDLDFVLTSERLMGNWPEVPSLHIYECLRDPHVRGGGHPALHVERSAPASGVRMSKLPAATREWLAGPGLARLWEAVRKRLESNGVQATGSLRLTSVSPLERNALSLLLGKPVTGAAVTVRLDALDARLRASAAGLGLRDALEELGPPLTDRRAVRAGVTARREHIWSSLGSALDASPLAGQDWTRQWYDLLRHTGVPRGVPPEAAVRTLQQAVKVLTVLLGPEQGGTRGRGELAAMATGSAHGLDDGTWLARLVQRGIALAHGTEFPGDAASRRALWRLVSVTPDEVSSTVLTYGLRPVGGGWREQALRERSIHHAEAHLTLRDLHDQQLRLPAGTVIHICENPRVVEAAADAACVRPLVCTSGSAATVVLTLLDALATTGCRFAYHGDFDWPGIALANRIILRYGALPWRMGAEDYEHLAARSQREGIPQLPLDGQPVSAAWDQHLAPAMTALGVALHEEVTLDLLVDDLSGRT
ncbi:hypothetical protein GCM10010365_64850 [Streptomyces poonensis]|uniref:TIGR02679 family protein n=1 Tax=Streptomyces poonensis TaxID=68255 RepID=A0A918Q5R8_9ACTN|nr:hypothetical protein GCM10010365_64850 [Streptomyces poonensis]GLJ89547.1 hypothetical protein GCM10017589_21470 [Streptomyces poonensis]